MLDVSSDDHPLLGCMHTGGNLLPLTSLVPLFNGVGGDQRPCRPTGGSAYGIDRKRWQSVVGVVPVTVIPEGVVIVGMALMCWCGRRVRRRRRRRRSGAVVMVIHSRTSKSVREGKGFSVFQFFQFSQFSFFFHGPNDFEWEEHEQWEEKKIVQAQGAVGGDNVEGVKGGGGWEIMFDIIIVCRLLEEMNIVLFLLCTRAHVVPGAGTYA